MAIVGALTTSAVLLHPFSIAHRWGLATLARCLWAAVSRERVTFLSLVTR